MAIPLMDEDVEVISKLGDAPGSDDGLSTAQLKAKFDLGSVRLKNFINSVLIPHMNQLIDVRALLNGILDSTLSMADKAANAKVTGDMLNKKLDKTGGNVTGNIDMGTKRIKNLGDPANDTDAVNKKYLVDYCATGEVALTLTAAGWSSEAPYTQTVQVAGLLDELKCEAYPEWPENPELEEELQWEAAKISSCRRTGTAMTFRCLNSRPEMDIPIIVEVWV